MNQEDKMWLKTGAGLFLFGILLTLFITRLDQKPDKKQDSEPAKANIVPIRLGTIKVEHSRIAPLSTGTNDVHVKSKSLDDFMMSEYQSDSQLTTIVFEGTEIVSDPQGNVIMIVTRNPKGDIIRRIQGEELEQLLKEQSSSETAPVISPTQNLPRRDR